MAFDLDVVINTPDYAVDMKAGLNTLQGASDAARIISETILTEKVPERKTHKSKVRTLLKNSFDGSFGQIFSVNIYDDELSRKYREIGWDVFSELISYYLNESIYNETANLSIAAQNVVDRLSARSDELIEQLRQSSLRNIHDASIKFDYDTKIRIRKNRDDQTVLAKFDRFTAKRLLAEIDKDPRDLIVSITRLNINTGNGRLQVKGGNETVAFGFALEYKTIKIEAKKIFSENLDHNNGLDSDKWKYLRISAKPVTLRDGKIIKYIIVGFYDA